MNTSQNGSAARKLDEALSRPREAGAGFDAAVTQKVRPDPELIERMTFEDPDTTQKVQLDPDLIAASIPEEPGRSGDGGDRPSGFRRRRPDDLPGAGAARFADGAPPPAWPAPPEPASLPPAPAPTSPAPLAPSEPAGRRSVGLATLLLLSGAALVLGLGLGSVAVSLLLQVLEAG